MVSKDFQATNLQLENNVLERDHPRFADTITVLLVATAHPTHADINMHASNASSKDITKVVALSRSEAVYGMRPKYLRYNVWDHELQNDQNARPLPFCLADWTEQAKPLPSVPAQEFFNISAMETISSNPDLFKIITPVNVEHFEQLLQTHPNCPFVDSVCKGLREGFWPWADTHYESYPSIVDESLGMPRDSAERDFI